MEYLKESIFILIVVFCIIGGTFIGLKGKISDTATGSINYFTAGILLVALGVEFLYCLVRELPNESDNKLVTYIVISVGLILCSFIIVKPRAHAAVQSRALKQQMQAIAPTGTNALRALSEESFLDVIKLILPKLINTFIIGTLIGIILGRGKSNYGVIIGLSIENFCLALLNTQKLKDHKIKEKHIIYSGILLISLFIVGLVLGRFVITRVQHTLDKGGHKGVAVDIDAFINVIGATTLIWIIEEELIPRAQTKSRDFATQSRWLYAGVLLAMILSWATNFNLVKE